MFHPIQSAPNRHSFLLIQLGDIGDVVLTLPSVQALRAAYPNSRIVACVREKARDIMTDCPWTDDVVVVTKASNGNAPSLAKTLDRHRKWFRDLRRQHFDVAVDFRTGTRGAIIAFLSGAKHRIGRFAEDGGLWRNRLFHTLVDPPDERSQYAVAHNLNILKPLGIEVDHPYLMFPLPAYRLTQAKQILEHVGLTSESPFIVFHPFSLWAYKEWTIPAGARLIDAITQKTGLSVLITGAPDERERAERLVRTCTCRPLNLAGKTTVGELAGVLKMAACFIGVDTAALHIAAAVGTPTIGLFGPSAAVSWAPRGNDHRVVTADLPCIPCRNKGCNESEFSRCMHTLSAERVLSCFEALCRTLHPEKTPLHGDNGLTHS